METQIRPTHPMPTSLVRQIARRKNGLHHENRLIKKNERTNPRIAQRRLLRNAKKH
jgi:hypothetical protein